MILNLSDVDIYYEIKGNGPYLFIVQSGEGDAQRTNQLVDELKSHFSVVTYDRRGLSRSIEKMPIPVTISSHSNDLYKLISSICSSPVNVLGCSIGAVIAVETSKGYEDFLSVLNGNFWNYRFFTFLFPSILQGDKAVTEITKQLERIKKVQHHFDAVAIIRGGGGDIGLSSFNQYVLSKAIAEFPLPVLTGIGHTANETVTEMVSYYNAITPTKLAEFLIQKFHNFSVPVKDAERKVGDISLRLLHDTKANFENTIRLFRASTRSLVNDHKHRVRQYNLQLQQQSVFRFKNELQVLDSFNELLMRGGGQKLKEEKSNVAQLQTDFKRASLYHLSTSKQRFSALERDLETMHPKNVLKRGYSITTLNGRAVVSVSGVSVGDALETRVFDGVLISKVKSKNEISDE